MKEEKQCIVKLRKYEKSLTANKLNLFVQTVHVFSLFDINWNSLICATSRRNANKTFSL